MTVLDASLLLDELLLARGVRCSRATSPTLAMAATQSPRQMLESAGVGSGLAAPESCVNCGRVLYGSYCTACGERRASDRDNSFWGFAKEALQTVTNTDRSFLSSLRMLLSRPGELTAEYMRGRRIGLMRPLQLFLLVNVVYFLFVSVTHFGLLNTTLYNHMHGGMWYSDVATHMVEKRLGKAKVSTDVYEDRLASYGKRFNAATDVQARTLIFTMVPAFALVVGIVHIRRRRYVVEHLVFALHFYSAFLILALLIVFCVAIPMALVDWAMHTSALNNPLMDPLLGLVSVGVLSWYLWHALRRAYGDSRLLSTVGAVMLTVGLVLVLYGYRSLLFLTTFWATRP